MPRGKKVLTLDDELELLMAEVNEKLEEQGEYGGQVYVGTKHIPIIRTPTNILAFDSLTGGGLIQPGLIELFGEESGGKTLLALMSCAAVQAQGKRCAWVKGEDFDVKWAAKQGVDMKKLIMIEATTGDTMLETLATFIESGLIDFAFLDSYQAIGYTRREVDAGVEKESYAGGGAPQLWGRFYHRVISAWNMHNAFNKNRGKARARTLCGLVGISQVRDAIGQFSGKGKPEPKPTQIRVLKHWKAISILCKKGEPRFLDASNTMKKRIASREWLLGVKKNKTAPTEGRAAAYRFHVRGDLFGVDREDEVVKLAKAYGLIEQRGAILEGYGIRVKGNKKEGLSAHDAFVERLRDDPTITQELYTDTLYAAMA